jgi:hypothetical protein
MAVSEVLAIIFHYFPKIKAQNAAFYQHSNPSLWANEADLIFPISTITPELMG